MADLKVREQIQEAPAHPENTAEQPVEVMFPVSHAGSPGAMELSLAPQGLQRRDPHPGQFMMSFWQKTVKGRPCRTTYQERCRNVRTNMKVEPMRIEAEPAPYPRFLRSLRPIDLKPLLQA